MWTVNGKVWRNVDNVDFLPCNTDFYLNNSTGKANMYGLIGQQ